MTGKLPDSGKWVYGGNGEYWAECPDPQCPERFRTDKYVSESIAASELDEHMKVIGCKGEQKDLD